MSVHLINAVTKQAVTRQSSIIRDQARAIVQSPLGQALPLNPQVTIISCIHPDSE